MKILFLTLVKINSLQERGIYQDLLRKFSQEGHEIFVVCPTERKEKKRTHIERDENFHLLKVWTFNLQKSHILEKGIGTLAIEYQFLAAIRTYFDKVKFDLVLYSTPPITFTKVIDFVKKRDQAKSYLLLKDIFPQNAVDMKMIKNNSFLHRFFLKKEKKLYEISDYIGCMSPANVDYLLKHNPEINAAKVEVNPNSIEPISIKIQEQEIKLIRKKYDVPVLKKVFVYGGNLGKPQGLDFLLATISECNNSDSFFLIIGSGTEFGRIANWFEEFQPINARLLHSIPKNDYDVLLAACDVGLIFLDPHFTIPNFPSRLLSYLEMKLPVIAATDPHTDVGSLLVQKECGYSIINQNMEEMQKAIHTLTTDQTLYEKMSENAYQLLISQFGVERSFNLIMNHFQ